MARTAAGLVVAAFVLLNCGTTFPQDNQTVESKVRLDLSTPTLAVKAWLDASWIGDATLVRQVLVDDQRQRDFLADSLKLSAALRALESAAAKRFGEAEANVTGLPDQSAKALLPKLTLQEDGDRATVTVNGALLPLQLRRVDGNWRVDVSELANDPRVRRMVSASSAATKVAEEVAAEITAGKFKTADEVKTAFFQRRVAAVKEVVR